MFLSWLTSKQRSHGRGKDEEEEQAAMALIHDDFTSTAQTRTRFSSSFIIILLLVLNAITGILLLQSWLYRSAPGACASSQLTHFVPHGAPIPLETTTITFEDILRFNDSSHEFWRDFASRAAEPYLPYFGAPSTLIDAAWSQLLLGEFPGVSDEEIATNPGLQRTFVENDRNPRTGHFHIGLDVLHSLHCLNEVRKALDEEHCSPRSSSPASGSGIWAQRSQQRMHIDHCLNHIRQSLQCRPDLAPAAMKKHVTTDGEEFYLGNAEEHSCYDWSKIRSWLDTRRESELGAWENS